MATAPTNEPTPFRLLVFGQSNTSGAHLRDPSQAWPRLLGHALEERLGRPVEVVIRPIYVHLPGAGAYLERELVRRRPNLVLLGATPYAFAQRMVGESVRQRFGGRLARAYERLESGFDRWTRHSRPGARVNHIARTVAARILGAKPISTYDAVIEGTAAVARRILREEGVALTIFNMNAFNFARADPAVLPLLKRFDADIAGIAGRAHAGHLDGGGRLASAAPEHLLPDGLHFKEAGHALIAAEFIRAIDAGQLSLER